MNHTPTTTTPLRDSIQAKLAAALPESWRPYAKTVVAFLIGLVGLLVSLFIIDDETGIKIVQAISFVATVLGVEQIPNLHPIPVEVAIPPATPATTATRERGTTLQRKPPKP